MTLFVVDSRWSFDEYAVQSSPLENLLPVV